MDRIGRYKIVRELGRGAMGVVYHAIDPNIGRPVAIKTIQFSSVRKPEEQERLRERLFREARSAGMLSHPGIVTIYDVEQQGDLAYIAMEYVDGPTLDQLLSEAGAITPERMFSIMGQTAVALDYAHGKGIVHRDIKPANIMIAGDGTAKITDFGIAKITASESLTMTGSIVGTPHYMSPEQIQGKAVDGRSDQFSLAVIAFEMLTGEKPYTGEHLTTVVYKIVAEEPAPPHRLNPSLSAAIEDVLAKAMAKAPEARYANCQEFTSSLESACQATKGWRPMARGGSLNEPTVAEVRRPPSPLATLPPPRRARQGVTTATAERRRSGFIPFLVAILLVAGLLAVVGRLITWPTIGRPSGRTKDADAARPEPQAKRKPPASKTEPPAVKTEPQAVNSEPLAANPPVSKSGSQPASKSGAEAPVGQPPAVQPPAVTESKPSPMGPPTQAPAESPAASPDQRKAASPPLSAQPLPPPSKRPAGPPVESGVPPPRRLPGRMAGAPQEVLVTSSPGGATVTLDGNAAACTTPCTLNAAPGPHTLAVIMPGYQLERRYIDVGSSPIELPPIVLRAPGGTLMLTSSPPGAAILVNGRRIEQVTPAQIPLAAGSYTITLEKDGKQVSEKVEISNGINYRKIVMGQ